MLSSGRLPRQSLDCSALARTCAANRRMWRAAVGRAMAADSAVDRRVRGPHAARAVAGSAALTAQCRSAAASAAVASWSACGGNVQCSHDRTQVGEQRCETVAGCSASVGPRATAGDVRAAVSSGVLTDCAVDDARGPLPHGRWVAAQQTAQAGQRSSAAYRAACGATCRAPTIGLGWLAAQRTAYVASVLAQWRRSR